MRRHLTTGLLALLLIMAAISVHQMKKRHSAEMEAADRALERVSAALDEMHNSYMEVHYEAQRLAKEQNDIRGSVSRHQQEVRRLQNEVESIKDWADTALPYAIASMRERPEITGAANYKDHLSARSTVRLKSEQPINQR